MAQAFNLKPDPQWSGRPGASPGTDLKRPDISVLIPVFNEAENIPPLFDQLLGVLRKLPYTFEIVAVNDGSRDNSLARLTDLAAAHHEVKVIDLRRNYGQTAA